MLSSGIEWLEHLYPKIYIKLKEAPSKEAYSIEALPAKLKGTTLIYKNENKKVFIHSAYDPEKEAKQWVDEVKIDSESVIILFGLGLGYHASEILQRMGKENLLLIVEPSMETFRIALNMDIVKQLLNDNRVAISVASDRNEMVYFLSQYIPYDKMEHCIVCDFGPYKYIFSTQYGEFISAVKDVMNAKTINRNTLLHFAAQWQENFFKNLPYALESIPISMLFDKFIDKPVIIVSAGPSLNKNIDLLKEVQDKAFILCVGTALKALLRRGIKPHAVITVDGGYPNYVHFKDISCDCPLIYSFTVYPDIVKEWQGPRILMGMFDPMSLWFQEKLGIPLGMIMAGPSVANVAFGLAMAMKADPIILIGQDLAYAEDGRTHASGTSYDSAYVDFNNKKYTYVEGVNGDLVPTDLSFMSFKLWFENAIQCMADKATVIDATEGGAKIQGTKIMTLKDAIHEYCREEIKADAVLNEMFDAYEFLSKDKMRKMLSELKESLNSLRDISRWARKGVRLSEELIDIYKYNKRNNVNSILKRLDKIDKDIKSQKEHLTLISSIFELVTFRVLEGFQKTESRTEIEDNIRIAERSKALYEGMRSVITYIIPYIEESIEEIGKLIGEEMDAINV